MENGTIWGHGAYLGPDFSATYFHDLGLSTADTIAQQHYGESYAALKEAGRAVVREAQVALLLKQNRYDDRNGKLTYTQPEANTLQPSRFHWTNYFANPGTMPVSSRI